MRPFNTVSDAENMQFHLGGIYDIHTAKASCAFDFDLTGFLDGLHSKLPNSASVQGMQKEAVLTQKLILKAKEQEQF